MPVAAHKHTAANISNKSSRRRLFWYLIRIAVRAMKQQSAIAVKTPTVIYVEVSCVPVTKIESIYLEITHVNLAGRLDKPFSFFGVQCGTHLYT